jgi:cytochrome P450
MSLPQLDHHPSKDGRHKAPPPIEWVSSLGCWCVYDAADITMILKSADFSVANYVEVYRSLEQRVGMDCSTLIRALRHIPLANEGKTHAELRRDLARLVGAQTDETKQHLATLIHATVTNVCRRCSRVDLVECIVRPVADALFASLLGVELPAKVGRGVSVSQIFDRFLGLNRRKVINAQAYGMLQAFSAATDRLKTSPDHALALTIIGHDSIVASLGCSLLRVLEDGAGKRLCELSFPRSLPETGVPYVERLANRECSVNGTKLRAGDRVRLYLDAAKGSEGRAEANSFFGRGRHSCIGEEVSTWLWQTLTAELSRLPLKFSIETVRRRERDYVFAFYSSIEVQFHA